MKMPLVVVIPPELRHAFVGGLHDILGDLCRAAADIFGGGDHAAASSTAVDAFLAFRMALAWPP